RVRAGAGHLLRRPGARPRPWRPAVPAARAGDRLGPGGGPVPRRGGGAVAVVAPRRPRPAGRRGGDRRQRRLRAGVLLWRARRGAVPPGGDPGDRRVVGAARHAAARRGGDRAVVPRRGRRLAAGGGARARVVLRLAGRRPDRRENGLTRLVQSASWKAPRPCSPPSTSRHAPNRPARLRAVVSAGWLRFQPGAQVAGLWGRATPN